jgi:peroxiredoxin
MPLLTIRFDDQDRSTPAPYFRLPSAQGGWVSSLDFHEQSNLILLFLHTKACPACLEFLNALTARGSDYIQADASLVVILPQPVETLGLPPGLAGFPILFLADPSGSVRQEYARLMAAHLVGENDVMLFALDNYGAPYACLVGPQPEPSAHDELLAWLRFIGIQCPE